MPRVALVARGNQGQGRISSGAIQIPDDTNFFTLRIARNGWTDLGAGGGAATHTLDDGSDSVIVGALDTEVIRVAIWMQAPGGWQFVGHVGTLGGVRIDRRGDTILETRYFGLLPAGTNRKVKLIADVLIPSLTTQIDIDCESLVLPAVIAKDDHHSIAVEGTASGSAFGASSVTTSGNLAVTGSNRLAVAFGGSSSGGGGGSYSSMTFGGQTMTQKTFDSYRTFYSLASATLLSASFPASGTVTWTNGSAMDEIAVGAVSFSGVAQTGSTGTAPTISTGGSSAPSHTVTAGAAGDVRIAGAYGGGAASNSIGSGETSRVNLTFGGYNNWIGVCTKEDGGSDAMNWSTSETDWGMRGFNVVMDTGGAATSLVTARRTNMGALLRF